MDDQHADGPTGSSDPDPSGTDPAVTDTAGDGGGSGAHRRPRWVRRHWIVSSVLLVVLALVLGAGVFVYNLNHKLDNIARADIDIPEEGRPAQLDPTAQNILLLGEDNDQGTHRSDTTIVAHIPADRDEAFLVSIPRDSYVPIYDGDGNETGKNKINAAYSEYGPAGTQETVEQLTGIRIDHVAIIDFEGFKDLSTAVGGVRVYVPETFYDDSQEITWEEGWQNLEGERALQYVRTRHGLPDGSSDFGRIARQQYFLKSLVDKVVSNGTIANPIKLNNALEAITQNLTVDDDWSSSDIRGFALSLRGMSSDDIDFLTAPFKKFEDNEAGSVVILAKKPSTTLFDAVGSGDEQAVEDYVDKHADDPYANDGQVY